MADPLDVRQEAERLAGPHEAITLSGRSCDFWIDMNVGRCNCPRRERARDIEASLARARREALEEAAMLHENIDVACDHERPRHPGAGAMAAVIEYRDAIRALAAEAGMGTK